MLNTQKPFKLTNFMEQSPWEANSHSTSQEIPSFYGRFITMFTRAYHWSLPWSRL